MTAAKGYFRQEFEALHFDCNSTLPVSRILYPYYSPVAANPLLFSTSDLGRQYHHQLDWRILHEFKITVKEDAPGTDVSGCTLLLRAILRLDRHRQLHRKPL
jgi:hypothetical protein